MRRLRPPEREWLAGRLEAQLARWRIPGAAVVVIAGGDETRVTAGVRRLEPRLPVDERTLFPLHSIGKLLTCAVAARTVGRDGGWDAPIDDVVPRSDGAAPPIALATMRDLLSHRSGMPAYALFWASGVVGDRAALVERLPDVPAAAPPGARFELSDLMYIVAGHVMERRARAAWETLLADLASAAGLRGARHTWSDAESAETLAGSYAWSPRSATWRALERHRPPAFASPIGTTSATVDDLACIVRLHLVPGALTHTDLAQLRETCILVSEPGPPSFVVVEGYTMAYAALRYRSERLLWKGGFTGAVALLAEHGVGIGLVANAYSEEFFGSVIYSVLDRLFGIDDLDTLDAQYGEPGSVVDPFAAPTRRDPPLVDAAVAATYRHRGLGPLELASRHDGTVALRYGTLTFPVQATRRGRIYAETSGWFPPAVPIRVAARRGIEVTFEPSVGPVPFDRGPEPATAAADGDAVAR